MGGSTSSTYYLSHSTVSTTTDCFNQAHQPDNLNFLLALALKIDNARKFGDDFVEILDKEIDLGSCVKVFAAKSNLHSLLGPIMTPSANDTGDGQVKSMTQPSKAAIGLAR